MGLIVSQLDSKWPPISFTFSSVALLIISFFITFMTLFLYKSRKKHSLKHLPGPRGIPILGNLPFLEPNLHAHFARLAQTHGPIFKLHFGTKLAVVVTSPSLAKQVLKDHDTTFANRDISQLGETISFGVSDIVWKPYGPEWRALRKVCVRGMLSNVSLDAVYSLRRREVQRMVREMHGKIGLPVNVGEELLSTVWNIIMSMLWGDGADDDDDERMVTSLGVEVRRLVDEMKELLGKPNVSDIFQGLEWFDLQGIHRRLKGVMLKVERVFDTIVEERMKLMESDDDGGRDRKDFLQILLQLIKEEGDHDEGMTTFTMNNLKGLFMVIGLAQLIMSYNIRCF